MAIEKRRKKKGTVHVVKVRDRFGKLYPSKTFDRKVDAQRYERELLAQRDQGVFALSFKQRNHTLETYWSLWAKNCRQEVAEGWQMSQNQMARDHILPYLSKLKLGEIMAQDIGNLLGSLKDKGLSSQTRLHIYNILNKMFEDAKEHFCFLSASPMRKRYRPKVVHKARNFLSPSESRQLLLQSKDKWFGPAVWISLLCGLRPGEVQFLQVRHIDFDYNQIDIRGTYCRKTKNLKNCTK